MRTLTKLTAGAAVLLVLAGCTNGPRSEPSDPEVSADLIDAAAAAGSGNGAVQSSNKQLLAEEGDYKFYSLVPVAGSTESSGGSLCVVIQFEESGESMGCGETNPYVGLGFGDSDDLLEAKLAFAGYNAGQDLAQGWRYLHPNLLVRGLDDAQPRLAALDAPEEPADTLTGDAKHLFGVKADSARLLVKDEAHAFYAAIPNEPAKGDICLVVENLKAETASASCSRFPSAELGAAGVKAKLVVDDYDAGKELAEGWRPLHPNLLVNP
ncbi:MAG TPA: hypothetical protein VN601_07225 [Arthrobacter sp.]|nr:hypothetical protein [Arthrobacter sp.]